MTSKIISLTTESPFSPEAGVTLYPATIILENNDSGMTYMKTQGQYKEGDTIEYEKTGNKIKIKRLGGYTQTATREPKSFRSGVKNPEDYLGFIYGYAKDIHIAEMTISKKVIPLDNLKRNVEEMYSHLQEVLLMKQS